MFSCCSIDVTLHYNASEKKKHNLYSTVGGPKVTDRLMPIVVSLEMSAEESSFARRCMA